MNLEDCFNFTSRIRLNDYDVLPVFGYIEKAGGNKRIFYDVSYVFSKNGNSVSEEIAMSEMSLSDLKTIFEYTFEIANEIGYRKLLFPFPSIFLKSPGDIISSLFSGESAYLKINFRDFQQLHSSDDFVALKRFGFDLKVIVDFTDISNSDVVFSFPKEVFAVRLSDECFRFYYSNKKRFLSSYLNKMRNKLDFVIVCGVSHADQFLFCKAKDISVQGYFVDFIRRFS